MKNFLSAFFKKKESTQDSDTLVQENYLQDSPELVGYVNINEQILTYNAMLTFFNTSQSILDVGCGRGDLFAFLKERYEDVFLDSNYYGIDTSEPLINAGKERYGINNIHVHDFASFKNASKFNWVFACNFFNEFKEDKYEYLYKCIDKMYNLSNHGVAFNIITDQANIQKEYEQYYSLYNAGEILNYLNLTYKKVITRSDYLVGDTTFYIFKQ